MIQTGICYDKPFGKELFGKQNTTHYIYPREELISHDIFPYFILDGGAFNLANDMFGSATGERMLEMVLSDELFQIFRNGEEFNWEKSFAYTEGTEFRKKYEMQIWPQRLYMILPLAHAFLKTGDRKYADKWLETVRGWDKAHPYQSFDDSVSYFYTDMVWRDMQVAWRTLSLLHSVFMLQDAPFSQEDWKYLYDFIYLHIKHLYLEAEDRLNRQHVQNHVLQIGTALVLGASLFPEFDIAPRALEIGKQVVKMNMAGIYAEGGSDEDSPSYSHFIARLYLEAYLLLKNNGLPEIEGLEESIRKQYEWIWLTVTPVGNVPRLSDSYSIDSLADLKIVEKLFPLSKPEQKSVLMEQNRFAVLRRGRFTLYVDAINMNGGHRHYGRPQTLLYYDDQPILVDMGCCNYDRWEFYGDVRLMKNHSVVSMEGINEYECEPETGILAFDEDHVKAYAKVTYHGMTYRWERDWYLTDNGLRMEDKADADAEIPWLSRFFFARNDTYMPNPNQMQQLFGHSLLTVDSQCPVERLLVPVMNDNNKIDYAVVLSSRQTGKSFANVTTLTFEDR